MITLLIVQLLFFFLLKFTIIIIEGRGGVTLAPRGEGAGNYNEQKSFSECSYNGLLSHGGHILKNPIIFDP
jgi:hypothetical protein